ncbi:F0F1 ATP synthase subunit gamma, partial [Sphingorhabdus sp.]|uniref:F0F1 ATP synthase subunit gamma n=1 Tax=Sphingorhabdus sp. TaxID=1902408 RepID=UPI00391BFF94
DIIHSIEPGDLGKLTFADVQAWGEDLSARFEAGDFDIAHLFFSKFENVLTQTPTQIQLMPVAVSAGEGDTVGLSATVEYEPDEEEILAELLPRNVAVQLLRANRENAASEQGSKMTAMDNATRNAGDMINKLTIQYNRTRQAAITTELIEIIAGAEAL